MSAVGDSTGQNAIQVNDVPSVGVPASAGSGAASFGGLCPIKPEYRRPLPERVVLDADGRTRGMNKGSQRERPQNVAGTERPLFEGEINFLRGEQLTLIKAAVRQAKGKNDWDSRKRERTTDGGAGEGGAPPAASTTEVPTAEANGSPVEPTEAVEAPPTEVDADVDAQKAKLAKERASLVTKREENQRTAEEKFVFRQNMLRNKMILAPLTTVGNLPFRRICKEFGADVTLSEMAMVFNLNNIQKSEWSLLRRHESEDIFGIQIGVSRADDARAFAKALAASDFQYDYIDINCGCPVELMVKRGCGCGLMAKKGRLRQVVEELVAHQPQPVTIKCRIGEDDWTLHNVIGEFESWGASAVTIHGRTRKQRYTKAANWDYIEKCAKLTNLPVVGNGDIFSVEDVEEHRRLAPSVVSYMTGRGALTKPWLFQEIKENTTRDISSSERFEMLRRFCDYGMRHWGADERGILNTRRFLCEALSFLCRYVPVGLLERLPQRMNDRPPYFVGRDDMETLMASDSAQDWIKISEMLLGPAGDKFKFTPKHKSNSYAVAPDGTALVVDRETGGAQEEG